jgi:hypothetical protein
MLIRLPKALILGVFVPLLASSGLAQTGSPELDRIIQRFDQFEATEQAQMLASIQSFIYAQKGPVLASIGHLEAFLADGKLVQIDPEKPRYYDAKKFAPALKLRTRVIKSSSSAGRSLGKKYPNTEADIDPANWHWSYGRKALIRPENERSNVEKLKLLWQGKLPQSSLISSQIEALLHTDDRQTEIADYFEHCYRDRKGKVYPGLSLARMWGSGATFGISDVESVAYLQLILDEHQIKSPIPKRLHDGIYSLIRDSFAEYRDYRQLRQGLAARYADPAGQVPPILASITERFDLAWVYLNYDIARMKKFLQQNPGRKEFLIALSAMEKEPPVEAEFVQQILADRAAFSSRLASYARDAMRREGLMGLRGR